MQAFWVVVCDDSKRFVEDDNIFKLVDELEVLATPITELIEAEDEFAVDTDDVVTVVEAPDCTTTWPAA